jgi:winged helix domain-containing protein
MKSDRISIFKLHKAGLAISLDVELHGGSYPIRHGRYRLETPVTVVGEAMA